MRDFNVPLAAALTAATAAGAPAGAQAEAVPFSATNQELEQCLQATEPSENYVFSQEHFWGDDATASRAAGRMAAARLTEADPVVVGRERVRFSLTADQVGNITRTDGSECAGEGFMRGVLIVRAGSGERGEPSRSRVLHRSLVEITYDNGKIDAGQPARDQASGTIAYGRFCKVDPANTRLDIRATAGYYEPNGGGVERYHDSRKLPCPEPRGANLRHHGHRQQGHGNRG
jgi:hypothetical protein